MCSEHAWLIAGLVFLFVPAIVPAPTGLPETAWLASGLALAMALWWLTEALPLAATALLPLAIAPLFGLTNITQVASNYSHPLIILFLGGFLLAKTIEKCGLHRQLAFRILRLAGRNPERILAATMGATAFLSLWISNTASAMVIAPVAGAIAESQRDRKGFATALLLGVAFAATAGGIGTLIGTPPNAIFAAYVSTTYGIEIGFARWALVGMPVAGIMLFLAWVVLARVSPGIRTDRLTTTFGTELTDFSTAERRVAMIAGLTAAAWITRPLLERLLPGVMLSDAGIAMVAAVALFILPDGKNGRLLDWKTASRLRWDVLILFGGGLALAGIIESSGVAEVIGGRIIESQNLPQLLLILLMAAVIVYVGELASNTAMAAIFLPIGGAAAVGLGTDPITFLVPVAIAASVGFMLPVATPPNAIVFGYPSVTRANMLRAGAGLDVMGILVAVGVGWVLGPLVFGEIALH